MKWMWSIIFLFCINPFWCVAHEKGKGDMATLLQQLETEVAKGNLIALRDLGSLLDKKSARKEALKILQRYTFFLENEFQWDAKTDRQTFLDFFYSEQDRIHFFHPAEIFYISALDVEKVDYEIHALPKNVHTQKTVALRKGINAFEKAIETGDNFKIEKKLQTIIDLETQESQHYLLQIMQEELIQNSQLEGKNQLIILLAQALQNYATIETLTEILLNIQNGFLPFQEAKPVLAHLTNHSLAEMNEAEQGIEYFANLMDSLETMENIRYAGYEKIFNFNKFIFPHEVDFYGRIVGLADDYPWIKRNAIEDLMSTEHERAYLYLASDFYHNFLVGNPKESTTILSVKTYEKFFTKSNQLIIKVLDKKKQYINIFEKLEKPGEIDKILKQNFLLYWMSHHEDFEWNQSYELFINRFENLAKTENYEKLFRRLNSSNDEVAMESFIQLTQGTPAEIMTLANKYRQLLRSPNKTLPSIRHLYLEQLAILTDFCRNNEITYLPDSKLRKKLERLREDIPMQERYEMENRFINSLQIQEVTAVEYYTCLYENNNAFTFSVGRILDHYYSRHWNLVIQNDTQLRLYLKKAALFKRIGTSGSSSHYLTKLDTDSKDLVNRLSDLLEVEYDDDIIFLIEELLPQEQVTENADLQEFIEDPSEFNKNDIRILPKGNLEDFQRIIDQMQAESEVKILSKYLSYLRAYPMIEAVPIYFQLIDNQLVMGKKYNTPQTLGDLTVRVIEEAYNHHFKPEQKTKLYATQKWKTLWETDGDNYKNWVDLFFEQKLKELEFAEKLKIEVINDIFASNNYKPKYKESCLQALTKVRLMRDIKKLKMPTKLSVKMDLKYFEPFFFSYKDLDDIPKLFEMDDAMEMFDYLQSKTTEFDESELGTFWNNIFRQGWFIAFINDKKLNTPAAEKTFAQIQNLKNILKTYLHESDEISEYEEQATQLNISLLESIGKNLEEKLKNSIASNKEEKTKAVIQQTILARASYTDIGKILSVVNDLSSNQNFHPNLFLQKDFGLPIFNLDQEKNSQAVIEHHAKLSEFEFYKFYLKEFGVDFLNKKNQLDFQKIYELLQYEIVTPFVGGGRSHRDLFTYGLIKLLELHFDTRLGFHEKLNENQTFYSFTSTKRAKAWCGYLIDNQLVTPDDNLPPSFNDIVNK